ncbi:hypothetical protein [Adhaeretor mobilis]|uniref:Uncharacterized protein n=1 Tax=Adhaeretor mobilis TaxID=1930276 RepID=A0A517MPS3_9BACT|nr:hypothetical protein [Adhaeretor mobilis]QDS96787.1 hypothetical protein HG15A2_00450 [Adhaeretor mobilis]
MSSKTKVASGDAQAGTLVRPQPRSKVQLVISGTLVLAWLTLLAWVAYG